MPRLKKLTLKLVTAGIAVVVTLLCLEIALRICYAVDLARGGDLKERLERSRNMRPEKGQRLGSDITGLVQASEHDDVVYEMVPGVDVYFRNKVVRSNSIGMRDREYPVEKPPNTYRIACLGDSVMFGWGVDVDECYAKVLEQWLNDLPQPHPIYEVMNFALPGYNTSIEVALFERKALQFDPDLVLIQFINNDFGVPVFMRKPKTGLAWRTSYLRNLVRTRLGWIRRDVDERLVTHHFTGYTPQEKEEVQEAYLHMCYASGYRRAMARLASLTSPREIPVLLMRGTYKADQKEVVESVCAEHGFELLSIGPYTEEVLVAHGIGTDVTEQRRAIWLSKGDHHPNAFAHTIYAGGLMRKMAEMGIIPEEEGKKLRPAPPQE